MGKEQSKRMVTIMILSKEQYEMLPVDLQQYVKPTSDWNGFKTALKPAAEPIVMARKPAHEPIVMARKPFKGSTIDNVLKNGLGAMNIDESRIPWADDSNDAGLVERMENDPRWASGGQTNMANMWAEAIGVERVQRPKKSDTYALLKDKPIPEKKEWSKEALDGQLGLKAVMQPQEHMSPDGRYPSNVIGEVAEGYQKYFYCPKVSRKERHSGFEKEIEGIRFAPEPKDGCAAIIEGHEDQRCGDAKITIGNNHPTVKPVALMEYLIKLVTPPSTATHKRKVLDPFMGSGSTGMAATKLGHHFTGCELDAKYVKIAQTRIEAWNKDDSGLDPELFDI